MPKQWSLLLSALMLCSPQLGAQTTTQDFTFQVSAQTWTDTGLDLQSGDKIDISASPASTASGAPACDPKGLSGNVASTVDLPLPTAPAGALIARLHAQGAIPILIGASTQLTIEESAHLFLGMNLAGAPSCQGSLTVKIHRTPAGSTPAHAASATSLLSELLPSSSEAGPQPSSTTSGSGSTGSQQETRGEQLKSQLETAAQVFMAGQFGTGNADSGTSTGSGASGGSSAASPLKVSDAALDGNLRHSLDGLPRRVNDQFKNLGDMVNFVIVGNQKDVQAALDAASWHVADTNNEKAVLNAIEETFDEKDYLQMPMSTLYLFGRKQDFGYEMAEPIAMVASRHHFRIWKGPFTWTGKEVWVGAGTHDIGFAKDKRNGSITHKIDPSVDGERDNIGSSLQKANKTKTLSYYLPPNAVQEAKNATGDGYHSDGRLLVIVLP